jgi:hypothetical protein
MKIRQILLAFSLFFFTNCKSQTKQIQQYIIIEISNVSYSKIPPKYNLELLSEATKINKKSFSSAISGLSNNKTVDFPINDKVFNHEFFNGFDYNPQRKIKLYLQKYVFENKEYLIAVKIE